MPRLFVRIAVLVALMMSMPNPAQTSASNSVHSSLPSWHVTSGTIDPATGDNVVTFETATSSYHDNLVKRGKWIYVHKITPAKDPYKAASKLGAHDKKALKAFLSAKKIVVTSDPSTCYPRARPCPTSGTRQPSTYPPGCDDGWMTVTGKNNLGWSIYDYTEDVHWCWDGTLVSNTYRDRNVSVHLLFLEFKENFDDTDIVTDNGTRYHAPTQGHFQACIVFKDVGCFLNYYPRITLDAYGTGEITADWGY